MHRDSLNIAEHTAHKSFDFFNTKVIHKPIELKKSTRIMLVITLSIVNMIAIPYIIKAGAATGDMLGKSLNQAIHRDITSLK